MRLPYLDYLRGLAAFTIMLYHFVLFSVGDPPTDSFLKKAGIYGVSLFYVLSGLTLFHVYFNTWQTNLPTLFQFFTKRFFRIFPLLWLVTLLTLFFRPFPGYKMLLLNLTGLFGLVAPGAYIGTGVWSIGNELVFYLFFPLLLYLLHRNKPLLLVLAGILFRQYLAFAFVILPEFPKMVEAWKTYINPMNQAFLFLGGIGIGYLLRHKQFPQAFLLILLAVCLMVFVSYPVSGNAIHLITGWPRLVYTVLCLLIVSCLYKLHYPLPLLVRKPLALLGEISYGLYLLHPLVLFTLQVVFKGLQLRYLLPLSGLASLLLSYLVYRYYEKPFIGLGNRLIHSRKAFFPSE